MKLVLSLNEMGLMNKALIDYIETTKNYCLELDVVTEEEKDFYNLKIEEMLEQSGIYDSFVRIDDNTYEVEIATSYVYDYLDMLSHCYKEIDKLRPDVCTFINNHKKSFAKLSKKLNSGVVCKTTRYMFKLLGVERLYTDFIELVLKLEAPVNRILDRF